jgi:glycine cleavage system aminomethyltransferase T
MQTHARLVIVGAGIVGYGYSIGKLVGYAYLPVEHAETGTRLEIQYLDRRFLVVVSDDPQYDPKMERLKS